MRELPSQHTRAGPDPNSRALRGESHSYRPSEQVNHCKHHSAFATNLSVVSPRLGRYRCLGRAVELQSPSVADSSCRGMLSVVRKNRNSSGGLYQCRRRSAHDRHHSDPMRFLMKTLMVRPAPRLTNTFRQNPLCEVLRAPPAPAFRLLSGFQPNSSSKGSV